MTLTPQDVSSKRFTAVRLREGYDMGEVDQFLDQVEAELTRLLGENERLRGAEPASSVEPAADADSPSGTAAPAASVSPSEPAARPRATETLTVTTSAEASSAAARLLDLATRNAEEVEEQAHGEAERLLAQARADADALETESRARAEQVDSDARSRAHLLDSETEERRAQVLTDLDRERARLDAEVENLRAFEREYRARLRLYFQEQLDALDGDVAAAGQTTSVTPSVPEDGTPPEGGPEVPATDDSGSSEEAQEEAHEAAQEDARRDREQPTPLRDLISEQSGEDRS